MKKIIKIYYPRAASWILVIYLAVMVSGCSFRPTELPPEEARILQTREIIGSPEEIARATVSVLQEMHYTLLNVNMGLGIITAERNSERYLAPISRETLTESKINDDLQTFCLVAGAAAIIGLFLAWIFDGTEDDQDDEDWVDDRHQGSRLVHPHPGPVYIDSNDSGPDSYHYTMTITMEETSQQMTRVRVTVQGQHFEGADIVKSGPVQSQKFYADFYNRLDQIMNN